MGLLHSSEGDRPFCGGSLITSKTVLTAAHCTESYSASDISVVIGEHDVDDDNDGQQVVAVEEKIEHPDYYSGGIHLEADFALLLLSEPVTWRREVQPICLPGLEKRSYENVEVFLKTCLLYTSPSPRDS